MHGYTLEYPTEKLTVNIIAMLASAAAATTPTLVNLANFATTPTVHLAFASPAHLF